ncbi:MAG: glutamate-1-semialdehyde 2,1-aminomutase [Bacteroidota bacterium]
MNYDQSKRLFERAKKIIPGGVNSPVRAFKSVGGTPLFMKVAKGAYLYDEDGHAYLDMINSWGPMIMGHAYGPVIEAIKRQSEKSTSYGTPTELEVQMADLITDMVPNIEKIRMVNSGTEACMSAVRLARGYTGKNKIVKFAGCYHGHADCFLIQAGSGAITFGEPNSPGVTPGVAQDTLIARYNDLENVKEIMEANAGEIACLIIEPVAGNMGCIPPKNGFLQGLRELCDQHKIVLIFDEVMTGFRLAKGGAQELYNVEADLVTYGKVIGAGMPVGAFGGRNEIMSFLAPEGPVYQAGTLSGNPVAMTAGITLLKELNARPEIFKSLEQKTEKLHKGLSHEFESHSVPVQINRVGSMISVHFCEDPVVDFDSAKNGDNEHFKSFFHAMLENGVYLPPSAYETWFICEALEESDLEKLIFSVQKSLTASAVS